LKKADRDLQNRVSAMGKDNPYSIMMSGENMITKTHFEMLKASLWRFYPAYGSYLQ